MATSASQFFSILLIGLAWYLLLLPPHRDGSGSGSVQVSTGFGFSDFGFGVGFSPTVFRFEFGFDFGFWFPPVDIQWISEINYLELKLMFYNMLMIIYLLRLLNLLKIES